MQVIKKIRKLFAQGPVMAFKTAVRKFFCGKLMLFFESLGFHILPVHYYSPVPSLRSLSKNKNQWYKEGEFLGVDFKLNRQIGLLDELKAYKKECEGLAYYDNVTVRHFGEGYGEVEAHILHAMIRHFKPHRVIEVGSGISTFFAVGALSLNKKLDSVNSRMTCIEPYHWQRLNKINCDCELEVMNKPVQEVDLEFFKQLKENDILFIDSSHIVKAGSDVNYLYLEVLPILNKGVIIHIHDIPFPYPAFNRNLWLKGRYRFWNESALVQAFLTYNSDFEILLCSSYLHYKLPRALEETFTVYKPKEHFPTSLWIKRIV